MDTPLLSDEDDTTEIFVKDVAPCKKRGCLLDEGRTSVRVKRWCRFRLAVPAVISGVVILLLVLSGIIYYTRSNDVADGRENVTSLSLGFKNSSRPNIIFIVGDDIGWNDVGWRNPDMSTKNLNKLAENGVKFTQYYTYPTCSPSRAAFLTGRYSHRLGLQHRVIEERQTKHVPQNVPLLSEKLQELGYATHAVGKWHLGHCNWNYTPTHRGFDSFFGYRFATEDYYTHWKGNFYELWDNDKPYFERKKTYSTDLFSKRIMDVLTAHVKEQNPKPLFMYLAFQAIHGPTQETPANYRIVTPPNVKTNVRKINTHALYAMDVAVGDVVQKLKETGLYDNSLIIYTSDNGGAVANGGNNYPLRGGKFTLWEGGSRVAALVNGQMILNPGRSFDGIFHASDWFPTLLTAAGSPWKLDTPPPYDGIDQWEAIRTGMTSSKSRRGEIIYNVEKHGSAIRVGDFKLLLGDPIGVEWEKKVKKEHGSCIFSPNDGFQKQHCHPHLTSPMLFNVREDESEYHNLAGSLPDVVEQLRGRLETETARALPPQSEKSRNVQPFVKDHVLYPGWC